MQFCVIQPEIWYGFRTILLEIHGLHPKKLAMPRFLVQYFSGRENQPKSWPKTHKTNSMYSFLIFSNIRTHVEFKNENN